MLHLNTASVILDTLHRNSYSFIIASLTFNAIAHFRSCISEIHFISYPFYPEAHEAVIACDSLSCFWLTASSTLPPVTFLFKRLGPLWFERSLIAPLPKIYILNWLWSAQPLPMFASCLILPLSSWVFRSKWCIPHKFPHIWAWTAPAWWFFLLIGWSAVLSQFLPYRSSWKACNF